MVVVGFNMMKASSCNILEKIEHVLKLISLSH